MKCNKTITLGLSLLAGSFLLAGAAAAQTCLEPSEGLVSGWPADGTPEDPYSGLDARLGGGAGFGRGLVDQAFRFDGAGSGQDDFVGLPAAALHGLADLTVEFWVLTSETDQGAIVSAANGTTGGSNELLLMHDPGGTSGMWLYVKETSGGKLPVVLNDGAWHHVALAREGEEGRLYVDGVMVGAAMFPAGPLDVGMGGLMLGQEQDCLGGCVDPNQAFDGLVDEAAIYDRALTDQEIASIVDAGSNGKCIPAATPEVDLLTERIVRLESAMFELETHAGILEVHVSELERHTAVLEEHIRELEAHAASMTTHASAMEAQASEHAAALTALSERVVALEASAHDSAQCNSGPQNVWNAFRDAIKERIMRAHARR